MLVFLLYASDRLVDVAGRDLISRALALACWSPVHALSTDHCHEVSEFLQSEDFAEQHAPGVYHYVSMFRIAADELDQALRNQPCRKWKSCGKTISLPSRVGDRARIRNGRVEIICSASGLRGCKGVHAFPLRPCW